MQFVVGHIECCYWFSQALSIALLVSACVAISDVSIDTTGTSRSVVDMVEDSRSATGFLIFISLLVLLWELGLILVRLLNFGIVNRTFLVFGIVVSKQPKYDTDVYVHLVSVKYPATHYCTRYFGVCSYTDTQKSTFLKQYYTPLPTGHCIILPTYCVIS